MALRDRIKLEEALRLRPYRDIRDRLTIGWGRNLTDVGISQDEAEMFLTHDLEKVESDLRMRWPPFVKLDPIRQDVLRDMCFNNGIGGLLLFNHMLAACARGDYTTAALEMRNSRWASQVGHRAEKLAVEMESGVPYA